MKDFELLLLDGTNPSGVSMTRDILAAAALLAARNGEAAPSWGLHSVAGGRVELQGGIAAATTRLPARRKPARSVLLVPGIWVADARELRTRLDADDCRQAVRHIAAHVAGGGQVAASCSAVFLLQAAGVLAGRHATTTWWLAPELARIAADVRVEANRILCIDGPVLTAGAAFAQSDLVLHLLRARFGARIADGVSRVLLLHERGQQAQFVVPAMLASGDALVARLTRRVETALPDVPSVAELAGELCVSERTLGRRVRHATGMGTIALIRSIRLHRARSLLQNSRLSIERVAAAVGYQDATALRRLMRKAAGTTPAGMRATVAVAAPRRRERGRA
ncbi:transcriptional regulator GlxA family with amidase domain [Dokdonella fugitiva]|uniref:Transcriptional regulator GlxA family with amidase domain n=1 Tax=Dokdonella fugitiva TaxID=328517 RepID=A0A839F0V5_9GAMM|nr:helix-turn-helix domain-containing protein [Dokdonella fugitiva]MBA8885954.1 transcriptional regulator GlxA family with amidase domain [Dokdonella fugitiva]